MLDFVKEVGGKLLVSVANCEGIHSAHEPWHPGQAKLLFDLSREYGVPIAAAEFMNEPNKARCKLSKKLPYSTVFKWF